MVEINLKIATETYQEWENGVGRKKYGKYTKNTFVLFRDSIRGEYGYSLLCHLILFNPSTKIQEKRKHIYIGMTRIANIEMSHEVGKSKKKVAKNKKNIKHFLNKVDNHLDGTFYSLGKTEKFYRNLMDVLPDDQSDMLLSKLRDLTTLTNEELTKIIKTEVYSKIMIREWTDFKRILIELTQMKNELEITEPPVGTLKYLMNLPHDNKVQNMLKVLADYYEYRLFAYVFVAYCKRNDIGKENEAILARIRRKYYLDKRIVEIIDEMTSPYKNARKTINKIKRYLIKNNINELSEKIRLGHYTSLDTVPHLFKSDANEAQAFLRLTNSKQMNDPNEGIVLWKYLLGNIGVEKEYILSTSYISCATIDCDNLAMWNQYADSASGIMLEYDTQFLTEILDEEDVRIGKVCYVALLEDGSLQTTDPEISKLLVELKKHIGDVLGISKNNREDKILEIRQLLGEISYLFKNMSYSHEQEYRILLEYGENQEKERNIEPLISDKGITLHIKLKPVELRYSRAILGPRAVDIDYIAPYLKLCNPEIVIERSKIDFR